MTITSSGNRARRPLLVGFVIGAAAVLVIVGALGLVSGFVPNPLAPSPALTAQEQRGEVIYNANCQSCHGGRTGGSMMDYPPRHNANGHTWHHPDCELVAIVRDGSDAMTDMMREMMAPPGAPKMQAFKDRLSDDEIAAVLAYIKTMWTLEERATQTNITRQSCPSARG